MNRVLTASLGSLILSLCGAGPVLAQAPIERTRDLAAVADTTLYTGVEGDRTAAAMNFGTQGRLQLGYEDPTFWGSSVPQPGYGRILLRFDLTSLPDDAQVTSAALYLLPMQDVDLTPFPINCQRVTSAWIESGTQGVTENTAPTYTLEDVATFTGSGLYCDLTDLAVGWVDGTTPNYGLLVEAAEETTAQVAFRSRETPGTLRPLLRVTYLSSNVPPSVVITAPGASLLIDPGDPVTISWNGTDPDSDATVSIAADLDQVPDNGNEIWIATNAPEDGTREWNTSGLLGTYYVFARITDGQSTTETYSEAAVVIGSESLSVVVGAVTDTSGTPDTAGPGELQGNFEPGQTVRITLFAISQDPVQRDVKMRLRIAPHLDVGNPVFVGYSTSDSPLLGYEVDFYSFDWTIPPGTAPAQYDVDAELTDATGTVSYASLSWTRGFTVTRPADGITRQFALLLGSGAWASDPDAVREQRALADVTATRNTLLSLGTNWDSSRMLTLANGNVSRATIEEALSVLGAAMDGDDLLLFSYLGDGTSDGLNLYSGELLTPRGLGDAMASYIPRSARAVVVIQAAESGPFADQESSTSSRERTLYLASQSTDQPAVWDALYNGTAGVTLFNYYVNAALEGAADSNGDGQVTSGELAYYVALRVSLASGGLMTPQQVMNEGADGLPLMQLALPAGTIPAISLVEPFGDLTVAQGQPVTVSWTDQDPDSAARVRLAATLEAAADPWLVPDPTWITKTQLLEDPDGTSDSFAWNTTSVPPGTYIVWGLIDDGDHLPRYASALGRVTVTEPPPGPFQKSAPANGAVNRPISQVGLSWGTSLKAASYEYCVDTANNNACDTSWIAVGKNTNASVTGLSMSTVYYWQVRSRNTNGATDADAGAWWTFSTEAPPLGAFAKLSPRNAATGQPNTVTLSWGASINAESYEYCIDDLYDSTCDTQWVNVGSNLQAVVSGLTYGKSYYWQVRAVNLGGTRFADSSSSWWRFSVLTLPTIFISTTDSAASETPGNNGQFVVRRSGGNSVVVTVPLAIGGSAVPGEDYQPLPGSVTLQAGVTSFVVNVVPIDDALAEDEEVVTVTLGEGTGYKLGTAKTSTIKIADSDSGTGTSDLILSSLGTVPRLGAGASFALQETTQNTGVDPAGASVTSFYLSTDSVWSATDVLLGSRAVPSLAAGALSSVSASLLVPPGTPGGKYYVIAKADAQRAVNESSETNNTRSAVAYVGPDLSVPSFYAPLTATRGTKLTIKVSTKNSGGGEAPASTTGIYLSIDYTFDASDVLFAGAAVPVLAPGATHEAVIDVTPSADLPTGDFYLIAVADGPGLVPETSEANNKRIRGITVR